MRVIEKNPQLYLFYGSNFVITKKKSLLKKTEDTLCSNVFILLYHSKFLENSYFYKFTYILCRYRLESHNPIL